MPTAAVTVIIPVYNNVHYLHHLLGEIEAQYDPKVEVLLINDGSSEQSLFELNQLTFNYPFIKIISKENGGLSDARNWGLNAAAGTYSIFLDPDDGVPHNYIELLVKAVKAGHDFYIFDFYYCKSDGKRELSLQGPYKGPEHFIKSLLVGSFHGSVCTKLIKTSLYKQYRISFPVGISISEDLLTVVKLLQKNLDVCYVNEPIYYYNVDNSILTSTRENKFFKQSAWIIEQLQKIDGKNQFEKQILHRKINLKFNIKRNNITNVKLTYNFKDYITLLKNFNLKDFIKFSLTLI